MYLETLLLPRQVIYQHKHEGVITTKLPVIWRAVILSLNLFSFSFRILCMLSDSYNIISMDDSLQAYIGNPSLSQIICLAKCQIVEKRHVENYQFAAYRIAVHSCLKSFLVLPCLQAQTPDKKASKLQVRK